MTKRAAGTGSIYKLPSGSWRALVTIGGKRTSFTGKTQKEAATWLKKTIGQVDQGLTIAGTKTRFDHILDDWLLIKENKLRGSTMQQYSILTNKYIKPNLGQLLAKDLNAARIQSLYNDLQAQGVGKRTIEVIHTILYGCLKHARRLGLVAQNWAEIVEAPRPGRKEMSVWSEDQVTEFLAGVPDPVFWRLAFATGMRRGELLGLKWEDLDWQAGTLKVRRQVFSPTGGGWLFQEPKTARGRRIIRLGPGLVEGLRIHFNESIPLLRGLAGDRWQENDLIFPSSVGTPRNGSNVSKQFQNLVKISGLPAIRFHDIRHSAASLMLLYGEPPVRVAGVLGQSIAVLLDTYAHYIPDDQESVSRLMDHLTTPITIDLSRTDRARKQ